MNILYICADRGIPIRGHKGAAVHVRTLTQAFARAGHHVTILTPRPGPEKGPSPEATIIHVPMPPKSTTAPDEATARDWQSLAYREVLIAAAQTIINQGQFDFIYERYSLWSDVGAWLTRATRLPLVLEVNAPLRQEAGRYRRMTNPLLAAQIESDQFKAAYAISAVSAQVSDYVIHYGARAKNVHVLPNGVDPNQFHPAVRGGAVRDVCDLHDRIVVGFVGRPRPWHDLDTLLQAMVKLREGNGRYHLLLVGQMPDTLPTQLAELGLQDAVICTGPIPHEDVPTHIAAMDVAVSPHPGLTDFYFSPLKLYEYMACGVPTVAADVGQPGRLIRDRETGMLYPPGDAAALADRIQTFIANPALARQIAWQGAVQILQNHTWDLNAEKVVRWIRPFPPSPTAKAADVLPILDPKLRQRLYRATHTDLAAGYLSRELTVYGKKGRARLERIQEIEMLKYKPRRRCVLRYEINGRHKKHGHAVNQTVIGKLFRDDRGLRFHHLHHFLQANGFAPDAADQITIPASLAYIAKMRMQVQAFAPGATLDTLADTTDITPLMPQTAQAIAKLHSITATPTAPDGKPLAINTYLLGDELENLEQFTIKLLNIHPEAGNRILALHRTLNARAEHLPPLPQPAPVHRDFYYSQILFDQDRVALIDFDLFAWGDPAIDVGNFSAHLYLLGQDKQHNLHALAPAADRFLEAYAQFRPVDDTFWARVSFYEAATFYRLLHVVSTRSWWAHLFELMLQLATHCLEAA
ncbi:MAG: glycosyltransferase [Anaerolineae bacterium]